MIYPQSSNKGLASSETMAGWSNLTEAWPTLADQKAQATLDQAEVGWSMDPEGFPPDLARDLREYLRSSRTNHSEVKVALARVVDAMALAEAKNEARYTELGARITGVEARQMGSEARLSNLERDAEEAGQFKISLIEEKAQETKRKLSDLRFERRKWWEVGIIVLKYLAIVAAGAGGGEVFHWLKK